MATGTKRSDGWPFFRLVATRIIGGGRYHAGWYRASDAASAILQASGGCWTTSTWSLSVANEVPPGTERWAELAANTP